MRDDVRNMRARYFPVECKRDRKVCVHLGILYGFVERDHTLVHGRYDGVLRRVAPSRRSRRVAPLGAEHWQRTGERRRTSLHVRRDKTFDIIGSVTSS